MVGDAEGTECRGRGGEGRGVGARAILRGPPTPVALRPSSLGLPPALVPPTQEFVPHCSALAPELGVVEIGQDLQASRDNARWPSRRLADERKCGGGWEPEERERLAPNPTAHRTMGRLP